MKERENIKIRLSFEKARFEMLDEKRKTLYEKYKKIEHTYNDSQKQAEKVWDLHEEITEICVKMHHVEEKIKDYQNLLKDKRTANITIHIGLDDEYYKLIIKQKTV